MKKNTIYILITVVVTLSLVLGSTYAYYSSKTNSNNNAAKAVSSAFQVIYSGGEALGNNLEPSLDATGGINTEVKIRMGEDSVLPTANLYFYITEMTSNTINNYTEPWQKAIKWETYGYDSDNNLIYTKTGTFMECGTNNNEACTTEDKLYIANNVRLEYTDITFKIYIWLDAALADNGIINAAFNGTIGAETENFTGELE